MQTYRSIIDNEPVNVKELLSFTLVKKHVGVECGVCTTALCTCNISALLVSFERCLLGEGPTYPLIFTCLKAPIYSEYNKGCAVSCLCLIQQNSAC